MFAQLRNGEKGQVCKNQVIAEKATTPPPYYWELALRTKPEMNFLIT